MMRAEAYPEDERASRDSIGRVSCPFCGSRETDLHALFGTTQLASQYYCRACHTVFEAIKQPSEGLGTPGAF